LELNVPYTPVSQLNNLYPTDCPHLRAIRTEYAAWNWYTEDGYIRYSRGAHERTDYEHQMVAARAYGEIPQGYHVHHRNGDITHNDAFNLGIVSAAEHAALHRFTMLLVCICPTCGKRFERTLGQAKPQYERFFCSNACQGIANRKVKRPDAERLWQLMRDLRNWCALGRMFGVTDKSVKKWAKNYGLDLSVCDGRMRS
jgi:hypothetical protein